MRKRATGIVLRDGKVLLVKERRSHRFSLPGGGLSRVDHHSSRAAVVRELKEETSLRAKTAPNFLFHYRTHTTRHSVYLIRGAVGRIKLQRSELRDFVWWDWNSRLPLTRSTKSILSRWSHHGRRRRNWLARTVGRILHKVGLV